MKGLLAAGLGAALSLFALAALAQPFALDRPLAMLAKIAPQLELNTSQQQQWDAVMAQGKAAREATRANMIQVLSALRTELAKPEPDLAAVAALSDGVRQQNAALHRQTRDAWLALYAGFTPQQKAVVRDAIQAGLDQMEAKRSMQHGTLPSN